MRALLNPLGSLEGSVCESLKLLQRHRWWRLKCDMGMNSREWARAFDHTYCADGVALALDQISVAQGVQPSDALA
jgi:hypothetical protein